MSRAQQADVLSQATDTSKTNQTNAQTSESNTQTDIANQQSQLAKFAADNPYVQGGQLETATNKTIAGAADSTAAAAKSGEQQLAQRTGANASTGVAAGEAAQEAAERQVATQGAGATESRLAAGAKYGQDILGAGAGITSQQEQLAALQSGAAQGALNTEESAAQTPSFMDELGNSLITGGVGVASKYASSKLGG